VHAIHIGGWGFWIGLGTTLRAHPVVIDVEAVKLLRGGRTARAELHPAVAHDIEHGGLLRHLNGIVEVEGQKPDAVGDPDIPGPLTDRAVEDFGRGAVRVFFEEVMLDFPNVIHPDVIGQFDLREGFPVGVVFAERVPRPRRLHLVQQAELHKTVPPAQLLSCLTVFPR
jgi:hypothetical protein